MNFILAPFLPIGGFAIATAFVAAAPAQMKACVAI